MDANKDPAAGVALCLETMDGIDFIVGMVSMSVNNRTYRTRMQGTVWKIQVQILGVES